MMSIGDGRTIPDDLSYAWHIMAKFIQNFFSFLTKSKKLKMDSNT